MSRPTCVEVAAVVLDHRAQQRLVRGQAGHADAPALEVARASHLAACGDHRGERPLDERADPDHVLAAFARDAEVVDVDHRHVGAPGGEQLQRVGRGGRHADLEIDPVLAVEPEPLRRVDPGVHGVRLEVERERRPARVVAGVAAARGQREQRCEQEPAHGGQG